MALCAKQVTSPKSTLVTYQYPFSPSFLFYVGRPVIAINDPHELQMMLTKDPKTYVITTSFGASFLNWLNDTIALRHIRYSVIITNAARGDGQLRQCDISSLSLGLSEDSPFD